MNIYNNHINILMSDYDSYDYDHDLTYEYDSELDYGQSDYGENRGLINDKSEDYYFDDDMSDYRMEDDDIYVNDGEREDVGVITDSVYHDTKLESLMMGKVEELNEQIDLLIKKNGDKPYENIHDIPIDVINNIINKIYDPIEILRIEWTFNPYYKIYYDDSGFMVDFGKTVEEIHESLRPVDSILTKTRPNISNIIKKQMLIEKTKYDISKIKPISYSIKIDKLLNCYICVFIRLPPQHHQNMCITFTHNTNSYFVNKIDSEYRLAGGIDLSKYKGSFSSIDTNIIVDLSVMKNLRYLDAFGIFIKRLDYCKTLETLKLHDPRDDSIETIHGLPSLTYLSSNLTSLQKIYDLPKLKILSLNGTMVTNIDELKHLEKLDLSFTQIRSLNEFKNLKVLYLTYNPIDNLNDLISLQELSIIIDDLDHVIDPPNNFRITNLINLVYLRIRTNYRYNFLTEEYKEILQNNRCYIDINHID